MLDGKERQPPQEVQVQLQRTRATDASGVAKMKLPAGVLRRPPPDRTSLALAARADGGLEPRPLGLHAGQVGLADVVDVDVHRQPWHVHPEQVERGPALERPLPLEVRVAAELVENGLEIEDLLDDLLPETRGRGDLADAGRADHPTVSHSPSRRAGGTIRFHAVTSFPRADRSR